MTLDLARLCAELHRLEWARDLGAGVIQDIANVAEFREYSAGQIVVELDSEIKSAIFIVTGRLEVALVDRIGKEIERNSFRRGAVVGLISILLPERSWIQIEAREHSTVILLGLDDLLRLTAKYREFQLAILRTTASLVKHLLVVDRELPKPAIVAVIHHSGASRPLTLQLLRRLRQLGESAAVAGDDEHWTAIEGVPQKLIFEKGVSIGPERVKQLLLDWAPCSRLLIDCGVDHDLDDLQRVFGYADAVLWCIRPQDAGNAWQKLKAAEDQIVGLRDKVCLVWMLDRAAPTPPYVPELMELVVRNFQTYSGELLPNQGKLVQQGVERIVHYLRGVQIGLALGGGAARGMAHLGVLKALEQHGIYVDMLAGTSAGAMVGGVYAAGIDSEFATAAFKSDLTPPWFVRQIPGGGYWYLLYKYRRRQFGPMLRKYLHDLRMEQLVIPTMMISVDLVDGVTLVRDRGDATRNILESINLPPLSLPIIDSQQAVVDGGLLNNDPANVLVAKGCNVVIASTVTAKLEQDFAGIRSKKVAKLRPFLATIQVIMRQNLIQSRNMNAVGVAPADFVISPDVTAFDMSEFTRADEMAVIGETTTNASIHQLKAMLAKLDAKLFAYRTDGEGF